MIMVDEKKCECDYNPSCGEHTRAEDYEWPVFMHMPISGEKLLQQDYRAVIPFVFIM